MPVPTGEYTDFTDSTRDEVLFCCSDSIGIPRCPSQLERRPDFPEASWAGPWGPITTQEEHQTSRHNWRKTTRFSPQCMMRPFSAAVCQEKPHVPCWNSKGYLTPFMQLKKFPQIPILTREEYQVSRHNWRRAPLSPPHLEMSVYSPASCRKESRRFHRTSRGGWVSPGNSRGSPESCHNLKVHWFPHPLKIPLHLIPLHWLEYNPEYQLTTQREDWHPCCTFRKSPRSLLQLERRPHSSFTTREESGVPCFNTRRGLAPLYKCHRKPKIHVRTWEGPWVPHHNSKRTPRFPRQLKKNHEIPP